MLILTRRPGEAVVITTPAGEEIVVNVLGTKGNQVRVGVTAPKPVTVHRNEISARIKAEQHAAPVGA